MKRIKRPILTILLGTITLSTAVLSSAEGTKICLLSGMPPSDVEYKVIRNIKSGRHSFGSVNSILPKLFQLGEKYGADAIINYNGSQRFGFWPWQFIRPIATGTAVTWTLPEGNSCESIGGTYKSQLSTNSTRDA